MDVEVAGPRRRRQLRSPRKRGSLEDSFTRAPLELACDRPAEHADRLALPAERAQELRLLIGRFFDVSRAVRVRREPRVPAWCVFVLSAAPARIGDHRSTNTRSGAPAIARI